MLKNHEEEFFLYEDKILNGRIENYWNERSKNFSEVRRLELKSQDYLAWQKVLVEHLPSEKKLKILDVGTGAGFFAILLSKLGHKVTGIDMSEKMLDEAKKLSADFDCEIDFLKMDAQVLNFADESFDVVISRNLTWTLPDAMEAYREWSRILK
ncbi:MAG: class I SAM-dependent methyltransferase, partial [Selenomonadaceae bacterium]|nr:class I SAM-dependent methyltransferase [Selenomonadaceae bacterium]